MYKILKGQSESVNPREADNTIDKILKGQSEAVNPRKADNTIDNLGFTLLIAPLVYGTFVYCIVCLSRIYGF
jgi:hypothetical protein